MKRVNGKLLALCATALLFYGCEKEDDLFDKDRIDKQGGDEVCDMITFENREAGNYVSQVFSENNWGPIQVYNQARNSGGSLTLDNRAMIFDTGNPTGDDDDLAADWGNVLIIQELDVEDEPNDNRWGGEMWLTFPEPVTLESMRVLDIDEYEDDSWVILYDGDDNELYKVQLQPLGDNSKQTVNLGSTEGVVTLRVVLAGIDEAGRLDAVGSGAIDNIAFCVPGDDEERGCTRTQGYWKTHSGVKKNGNSGKYDNTWDNFLTKTLSNLGTYPDILWMAPKGDARIILAHQFIAAELNVAAGASMPQDVEDAWNAAKDYFAGNRTATRAQLLMWAEILDEYNNGLRGPGPCE